MGAVGFSVVGSARKALLVTTLFLMALPVAAQYRRSNLEVGGTIGFGLSDTYSMVNISPQVGYRFNQYFSAGGGIGYIYYGYKGGYSDYTYNYLGANLYARVNPIRYIALQVQPELYRVWGKGLESRVVPTFLVGAGGTIPIGYNGGVNVMVFYDVVQNDYSPYSIEPFLSVGYVFGF